MRRRFDFNPTFNSMPIEDVEISFKSRDELPPILAALQMIFPDEELRDKLLLLLEKDVKKGKMNTGRTGMDIWHIFVFACIRTGLNLDFDRLEDMGNNHITMRRIMRISDTRDITSFHHNTIRDNVSLITLETLEEIKSAVAQYGRSLFGSGEKMNIKTDSYVFETNVHFPTDLNLSWDCIEKCISLITADDELMRLGNWRKHKSWYTRLKSLYRNAVRTVYSGGADKRRRVNNAVSRCPEQCRSLSFKVDSTLSNAKQSGIRTYETDCFYQMPEKHIDLISRRLLNEEKIPHSEKVFSVFEPHTEWISKGKRHPSVEPGHRMLITTDENSLIVDSKVMINECDVSQVEGVIERLESAFGKGSVGSVSFDRGFTSAANKKYALEHTDKLCMPKKGKKNRAETLEENEKEFVKLRNRHSAVESDINCLEHHGLNRCPDRGLKAYIRYASLGVPAYNLHKIGNHILKCRKEKAKAS